MRNRLLGVIMISSLIFVGCDKMESEIITVDEEVVEGVGSIDIDEYLEEKDFILNQVKVSIKILDEPEAIDRAILEPLNDIRLHMKNLRETVVNSEVLEIEYKNIEVTKIDEIDNLCLNLETYLLDNEGTEKDGLIYFDLTGKESSELIKQLKQKVVNLEEDIKDNGR